MRVVVAAALILGCSSISSVAVAQNSNPPFTLSVTAVKPVVKAGAEVFINIVMTNKSDREINCSAAFASGVDRSFRYSIQDEKGRIVNKVVRKHPELDTATSVRLCTLKPGESTTTESRVGQDYDLKHPGTYLIQVSRPITDIPNAGFVTSNSISISVVE